MKRDWDGVLIQLATKIVELSEFIKDKLSMYQALKNRLEAIKVFHNNSKEEERVPKEQSPPVHQMTQITPNRTVTGKKKGSL